MTRVAEIFIDGGSLTPMSQLESLAGLSAWALNHLLDWIAITDAERVPKVYTFHHAMCPAPHRRPGRPRRRHWICRRGGMRGSPRRGGTVAAPHRSSFLPPPVLRCRYIVRCAARDSRHRRWPIPALCFPPAPMVRFHWSTAFRAVELPCAM